MSEALGDLKVLDLSWVVAGPLVGRALADFGAQVIRVESSTRVETARLMQPFHGGRPGVENSGLYGNCNAGKRGITVDLSRPEGREVIGDLVAWADIVLESFSPGRMARWGLDYETLSADHPGLIMVSSSIAGQSGPWSSLAGFGNVGASLSGFQNLVGWPDRLPIGPFGPYTDFVAPRLALATLLAAVEHREQTGRGCYIDVSQIEAGLYFLSPQVAHHSWDGTVAQRRGNADEQMAPHGVYRCRDEGDKQRFLAVAVRGEEDWHALCAVIGRADLAARADLRTLSGRQTAAEELDEAIERWTDGQNAAQAEELLQRRGVPAHLAAASEDFLADVQLAHRGHVVTLPHPEHGSTVVEGPRYLLGDTPGRPRAAAPLIGEHTVEVLRNVLGYTDDHIDELAKENVLV